eukprot:XP_019081912.1 PREDICTED: uncharacterized protein LOC109124292 isoform X2 [Vitis vinifera]
MALERALHAHGIHVNMEVSKLVHVQPDLVQQKNGYDYGIFALKYMEYWNGATLTQAVAESEENSGYGTETVGDGEFNLETGETQPQSAEKMRQSMQYMRRGHMKVNYTQMTMTKMSEQFWLR